jgi:hypothetical protein
MDDEEPDEDRMEARRRHNRRMAELDREIAEAARQREVPAAQPRPVTQVPAMPGFGRAAAKAGRDAEELWIDRMKAKYGYEP